MELFRPDAAYLASIAAAFEVRRAEIESGLPEAEVEHIGSTAVPGALTKGDLDLLVRVEAADFAGAVSFLGSRFAVNQPEVWSETFASFAEEPAGEIAVGVQLVGAGSEDDRLFVEWRERLTSEPELLEGYNRLKEGEAGSSPDAYIEAKGAFIEAELGGPVGRRDEG